MNWVNLRAWVNDPSTLLHNLRRAATELGLGIGGSTAQLRARLNVFIDNQRRIHGDDAPAAFDPNPTPPAPIADAQPVQPAARPAADQAQVTPEVTAQPVRPTPRVAREQQPDRMEGNGFMKYVMWIAALGVGAFLGAILIYEKPWKDEPSNSTTLVPIVTATAPTASPTATPTVVPVTTPDNSNVVTNDQLDTKLKAFQDNILMILRSSQVPATSTYQTPAATVTTSNNSLDVPVPAANCWTTGEAKSLTGVDVQRIGTEPCAWVWRAVGVGATTAQCPTGALCTFDTGNGIVVDMGAGSRTIVAGTWRKVDSYPETDAVHRPCELLAKEQQFGRQEDPSFTVHAGNGLDCPGVSAFPEPNLNPSNSTTASCPKTADEVAKLLGGNAGSWTKHGSNGWVYSGSVIGPFQVPSGGAVDYDAGGHAGRINAGGTVPQGSAFTLWCPV